VDKYLLPNFVDIHTIVPMIKSNKYCKNIVNNSDKLEKYYKINDPDKYGDSKLHDVCGNNESNIYYAKLLIKLGANINQVDKKGRTSLMMACCSNENADFVKLLINKGCDINVSSPIGTALHCSCFGGKIEHTKLLIEKNIKVDIQDEDGFTALHDACRNGKYECVKLLLDAGANQDLLNNKGRTALGLILDKTKNANLRKSERTDLSKCIGLLKFYK
jgi:ankyrin repeat protein